MAIGQIGDGDFTTSYKARKEANDSPVTFERRNRETGFYTILDLRWSARSLQFQRRQPKRELALIWLISASVVVPESVGRTSTVSNGSEIQYLRL